MRPRPRAARERLAKSVGKRKDGTEFPIELGFNPLASGDGVFLISEILDLTTGNQASKPPVPILWSSHTLLAKLRRPEALR